ncbi:MAG: hypothetical protein ACTSQO_06470 [Candidatus Helarchaeota archaeon]
MTARDIIRRSSNPYYFEDIYNYYLDNRFNNKISYYKLMASDEGICVIIGFFIILGSVITVITYMSAQYNYAMTGNLQAIANANMMVTIIWVVFIVIIVIIIIAIIKSGV